MAYWLPIAVVVCGNVFYHICAKSVPGDLNPFASVGVTYLIGAILCFVLFFCTAKETTLAGEIQKINWAPLVMGIAIILMEAGNIFVYRAGWSINVASLVVQGVVVLALAVVGYFMFSEAMTMNKAIGLAVVLVGLFIVNR